jgi:hypothetical protein
MHRQPMIPGRTGSSLVKAPTTLTNVGKEALNLATLDVGAMKLSRIPNSVDTLSPNNRFVKNVSAIPITPGIPYHTICGDRGRGDAPKSSDGIVPYWSSHLDGAQSELVVPSSHSAHQNPQAIEEVRRSNYTSPAATARSCVWRQPSKRMSTTPDMGSPRHGVMNARAYAHLWSFAWCAMRAGPSRGSSRSAAPRGPGSLASSATRAATRAK